MSVDPARYLRQIMLPEVGDTGQARIAAATAFVRGSGLAHEVAARYATRAGFGGVEPGPIDVTELAPSDVVQGDAAREVLAGSRAALSAVRHALADESRPGQERA